MSQEPYPRTDRAMPGSTPAEHTPSAAELERQDEDAERTPPSETVPDEAAERAAAAEDPVAQGPGDVPQDEDPMRRRASTSDAQGAPRGEQ